MENAVKSRLQSVQFGAVQTYKSIAIVPLIAPAGHGTDHRYKGKALAWTLAKVGNRTSRVNPSPR
jgi:hypothetical protein